MNFNFRIEEKLFGTNLFQVFRWWVTARASLSRWMTSQFRKINFSLDFSRRCVYSPTSRSSVQIAPTFDLHLNSDSDAVWCRLNENSRQLRDFDPKLIFLEIEGLFMEWLHFFYILYLKIVWIDARAVRIMMPWRSHWTWRVQNPRNSIRKCGIPSSSRKKSYK